MEPRRKKEPNVLTDLVNPSFTDEEFLRFCEQNPDLRIERTADKTIYFMPPLKTGSSRRESSVHGEVYMWSRLKGGGVVFSPNYGIMLPSGAYYCPDTAWISPQRWERLSENEKENSNRVLPDFIAEVRSPSDRLGALHDKMQDWVNNGVRLAWLIDPVGQQSWVYRPGRAPDLLPGFERELSGEDVMTEFRLDLRLLR